MAKKEAKTTKESLNELRAQLSTNKQKLDGLGSELAREIREAGTTRSESIQAIQGKAARDVKPCDDDKKKEISAAKDRFESAKDDAQRAYAQTESDAAIERGEAVSAAHGFFEEECENARRQFNSVAERIFEGRTKELAVVDDDHDNQVSKLKHTEIEARHELVKEIDGLETQIKFQVAEQKKAVEKMNKGLDKKSKKGKQAEATA